MALRSESMASRSTLAELAAPAPEVAVKRLAWRTPLTLGVPLAPSPSDEPERRNTPKGWGAGESKVAPLPAQSARAERAPNEPSTNQPFASSAGMRKLTAPEQPRQPGDASNSRISNVTGVRSRRRRCCSGGRYREKAGLWPWRFSVGLTV